MLKDYDFYLAGESYAGHYIPAFAKKILENDTSTIPLKGILIGDGLTDA
jgi:cathepsin A (carboxypeptidase C)